MNRLFRHDWIIVWNTTRAQFAGWHDRVLAPIVPLVVLAVARWWFADRPWTTSAWAALAAGTVIGIGAGRVIAARLTFHASDGLLATDALHTRIRRRYVAACHAIGLALLAMVTLIARPSLLVVSVPAYLAGALVVRLTDGIGLPSRILGKTRPGWTIRSWSHRPIAGVAAAAILLLSLLPARPLNMNALMGFVGIETILLALALTSVDDGIVRFMAIAGHGLRRIIVRHAEGLASFIAVAVPGFWALVGPVAASIVAAASVAMLLLLTLRILAYRLYHKRFADILVSTLVGLFMLAAYSVPVALPVVAVAMLWQLQRQGSAKTWSLA